MSVVTREILIEAPVEKFWDIVVDYDRYPEFVPGIRGCRVLPGDGSLVEYELDLGIKRIRYVLRHVAEPPRKLTWSLVSGELMKVSNGSWELRPEQGRTRAHYSVEIQIARPPLVPQAVMDRVSDELTRVQLPKTLEAFKVRAERG
jgi:coenzyme Q-binding protein COQ10